MARLFKISGYYIDPNGDWSDAELKTELEQRFDLIDKHIKVESVDIGEFEDDSPLNRYDSPIEECEKYFNSNVCNNKTPPAIKSEALCESCVVSQECNRYESCSDGCSRYSGAPCYGCSCVKIPNGTICPDYKHI